MADDLDQPFRAPAHDDQLLAHDLRAGHVTQAKRNDATDLEVMS